MIHITAAARDLSGPSVAARLQRAVVRIGPALLTATLTTIAAFLSFSFSSFSGLAVTGRLASCGLALNLILAATLLPALATFLPPGTGPQGRTLIDRVLGWVARVAVRRAWIVLVGALLLCVGVLGLSEELRFSEDLARLAPEDIPPAVTDRAIAQRFGRRRDRLVVMVQGSALQPVLQVNDALARRLEQLRTEGRVASYQGLAGLLPSLATQRRRQARLQSLDPSAVVRRLQRSLEEHGLRTAPFDPFFDALTRPRLLELERLPADLTPLLRGQLSQSGGQVLVATSVYLRPSTTPAALAAQLRALGNGAASVTVTGAAPAGHQMARLLEHDLLVIALCTCGVVLIMLGLMLRRPWPVIATLLSITWAGALFVGLMELWGAQMDLYALMVIPIIIGYGVDDHLYIIHRATRAGIQQGVVESGRPVVASTLSSVAAFGALGLCELPGLRTLGFTGTLGLLLGIFASLVILPALLSLGPSPDRGQLEQGQGGSGARAAD